MRLLWRLWWQRPDQVEDRSQPEGWDLDTCYACDGSGLEDVCERCLFVEEIDQEEL